MSKVNICKISKTGFIFYISAADHWVNKGKSILFRFKRRRDMEPEGWIYLQFIFLIFAFHLAIKGEIK